MEKIRRDTAGHRRGRPEELFRIADPLAESKPLQPEDLRALAALLRDPAAVEWIARPLETAFQLLTTEAGRAFFRDSLVPLVPPESREILNEMIGVFENLDTEIAAHLPQDVHTLVATRCGELLPQFATKLEAIATQSSQPEPALGTPDRIAPPPGRDKDSPSPSSP